MASNVKWIKMMVGMFDGMSFKKIKRAKIGGESFRDKLTAVWFELMDFAGKCNHEGAFISPSEIPFTDLADIATMIDRDEEELKLCMSFFITEGMVTVIDDVYSLSNWAEYQNAEGMEKIREQNRLRKQRQREKLKKTLIGDGTVCEYCGGNGTTVDHIIPKASGGLDVPENTVRCCSMCNMQKTNRNVDVFLNEKIATDSNFDVSRILENKKIMQYLYFDGKYFMSRNVTGQVTEGHGTEIDIDKEKEEDKEIYIKVIQHLNEKAGTRYKPSSSKTKTCIHARLAEGFTLDDFYMVIDKKCTEWIGTEWEKFLRPETLFGTKFEGYLNSKGRVNGNGRDQQSSSENPDYGTYL